MSEFRTRQAPSPTGFLHIGTARTVLFTKLFALINQGVYYLRIEDTDRSRLVPEAVKNLLNALDNIGLSPDEGVSLVKSNEDQSIDDYYGVYQRGDFGPYIQSERLVYYHKTANELIERGLAYWDYLEEEDLKELQELKKAIKKPINYYKANLEKLESLGLTEGNISQSVETNYTLDKPRALRYKIQRNSVTEVKDELLGESKFDLSLEEDFFILKSDNYPTYHLAHLVDDHMMKTSLVIRSQEWFASMGRHLTMFRDFYKGDFEPNYLHLPVILGETGNKKLSKRDGDVNLHDYLDRGYLPEAIINYLAFLGWNPGTDKEMYS